MPNKIKKLDKIEKPREKLFKYGVQKLNETELLATLLRTGIKQKGVLELSEEVSRVIFSNSGREVTIKELERIKGLGRTKISLILSAIELSRRIFSKNEAVVKNPEDIFNQMHDIKSLKKEHFVVFYLDTRSKILGREVISIGTVNASLVHPREVFEPAIRYLASGIILCHNHPSNVCDPSDSDIEITLRLKKCGDILGIKILDHVIVGETNWFSLKSNNLI